MSDRRPTSLGVGSAGVQGLFRVPAAAGSPPRAHAARSTPAARPLHSSVVGAERHPVRRSLRSSCSRCRKCRWRVLWSNQQHPRRVRAPSVCILPSSSRSLASSSTKVRRAQNPHNPHRKSFDWLVLVRARRSATLWLTSRLSTARAGSGFTTCPSPSASRALYRGVVSHRPARARSLL